MKPKIKYILFSSLVLLLAAGPAYADIAFCGGRAGGDNAPACEFSDLIVLFYTLVNWGIGIAALISVGYVFIGGAQMMLSAGNETRAKDGKETIKHALLGLVIVLMAYLIVGYVAGLLFPDLGLADPMQGLKRFIPFQVK